MATNLEVDNQISELDGNPDLMRVCRKLEQDRKDVNEKRRRWETWHRMRVVGIGRASLPFRGASDFHYPMIDTIIEQLKPFYFQQAIAPDPICNFVAKTTEEYGAASIVSQYFDYQMRREDCNFRTQVLITIDEMLEKSKGVMKLSWDHKKKCLKYESVNPLNIIVPPWTEKLETADRLCHIIYISVESYKRLAKAKDWLLDDDWIKSAAGCGEDNDDSKKDKQWIDGVNLTGQDREMMELWEVYSRNDEDKWEINLISPKRPGVKAKPTIIGIPWTDDELPFQEFNYEIRDRSYYGSRGITDIAGQWELLACKYLNEKNDYMSFVNRPIFVDEGATLNAQNMRFAPGQVISGKLEVLEMPQPPTSLDQELMNVRSIAERRVGMPDFGIGQNNTMDRPRTATEVKAITGLQGQNVDLRARIFREALTRLFNLSWKLILFYGKDDYEFYYRDEYKAVPNDSLKDAYVLEPNGNPDGFDKDKETQAILAIINQPVLQPYIRPDKAAKMILELQGARWMRELYNDNQDDTVEIERQYMETTMMLEGHGVSVKPYDDDEEHLKAMDEFIHFKQQQGSIAPPIPSLLIFTHYIQHADALKQKNPKLYKSIKQTLGQSVKLAKTNIANIQQMLQQGVNGMQVPQAPPQGGPVPPPPGQPMQGPPAGGPQLPPQGPAPMPPAPAGMPGGG
jgi:hypothetical protein